MATTGSIAAKTPMGNASTGFLTGYLLFGTALTFYSVYSLWSAQQRSDSGQVPAPQCAAAGAPTTLTNLYPEQVYTGSTSPDVLLIGCGFSATTQVKFNGTQRPALLVDASHIRVGLTSADLSAASTVVITISNGQSDLGSRVLKVVPPVVEWEFFGAGPSPITPEVQLLLMVLFTGAFGACVYALKSVADYRGDDELYDTWFLYYLIQPFEGAGIAFLFYLVIRGGFLAGASVDIKPANQFSMCAIAGLAGAFSDIAFLKLREVFLTLFKPQDDRGGKLNSTPGITTTKLLDGKVGSAYKQVLRATGLTAPLKWSVAPALPAGLSLDPATGTVSGTPTTASAKTTYTFTVVDSAAPPITISLGLALEIQ